MFPNKPTKELFPTDDKPKAGFPFAEKPIASSPFTNPNPIPKPFTIGGNQPANSPE